MPSIILEFVAALHSPGVLTVLFSNCPVLFDIEMSIKTDKADVVTFSHMSKLSENKLSLLMAICIWAFFFFFFFSLEHVLQICLTKDSILKTAPASPWQLVNLPTFSWLWRCPLWEVQLLKYCISDRHISALRFLSSCHRLTHHSEPYAKTDWPSPSGRRYAHWFIGPFMAFFALFK